MSSWIDRLSASRTTHAVELAARFAEQRHKLLAENLANVDTPDYVTRRLDVAPFQDSLQEALADSRKCRSEELILRRNAQFRSEPDGQLRVAPVNEPAENALFHDGTNSRLERTLADVTENSLRYDLATSMLRARLQNLLRAIRGRVE
jgi:flagellar basal-body rod protein FlgB